MKKRISFVALVALTWLVPRVLAAQAKAKTTTKGTRGWRTLRSVRND